VEHQKAERDIMQPLERLAEAFIVARQPTESRHPAERTLHQPAPWQKHETALGLGQLHDLQVDPVTRGITLGVVAGIALVDVRQFDRLPGPARRPA
jgi:hypothetical protein